MFALVKLEDVKKTLAQATRLHQVKAIRDKAEALRLYFKQQANGLLLQNQAAEIKLRAERKAGTLLTEMEKAKEGDALSVLKTLPDESIDMILTSPPYYGLRDYRVEGQIGLEPTLDEYLYKMLAVTAELKRVLKKTGTMWWNHGDSYGTGSGAGIRNGKQAKNLGTQSNENWQQNGKASIQGYEKSLLLQAHRLAIRMIDEQGWTLRNILIWHKPNVMPSSADDRFTVDIESIKLQKHLSLFFLYPLTP
jgi:DNA modification methylase